MDPKMAQQCLLPRTPRAPATARAFVRGCLTGREDQVVQATVLLASELVTLALRGGGTGLVVAVKPEPGEVRVQVQDAGTSTVTPPSRMLLEGTCHGWGLQRATRGTIAWGRVSDPRAA